MKKILIVGSLFVYLCIVWIVPVKLNKYGNILNVGLDLDNLVLPIDPTNNATLSNAFFSNNMYSNLIDIDEENNYNLELASKYWFDTQEKKLYFAFENSRITADDAVFTLRRLISQNRQLHTNFWNIICASGEKSDLCVNRIYSENSHLVINYSDENKAHFIIPTLASVDYKIVPLAAFDKSDYTVAKIQDYTKTSGHYHLVIENDKYFLVKNENSNLEIYKKFALIPFSSRMIDSKEWTTFESKVDIISTTVILSQASYDKLIMSGWKTFNSHRIKIGLIVFTKNGIAKTSIDERFSLASRIEKEIFKKVRHANSVRTIEFFQDYGQGYLDKKQLHEIEDLRSSNFVTSKKNIFFSVKSPDAWRQISLENRDIVITKTNEYIPNMPKEDQPDVFTLTNDVSFDLSLSLISYAVKTGLLDMSSKEVDDFADLATELERIDYINKIHFKTLKECMIYPMQASPYTTAFKGDFEHNLSKFNSRTLLWKIH